MGRPSVNVLSPHRVCLLFSRPSYPSTRTRSADHQEQVRDATVGGRSQAVAITLSHMPGPGKAGSGPKGSRPPPNYHHPRLILRSLWPPSPNRAKGWPGPGLHIPSPCFALKPWVLAQPLTLPGTITFPG